MVSAQFMLVASGHIATPRLQIALYVPGMVEAAKEADRVAATLSKADYFHFELYDVSVNDDNAVHLGSFRVEPVAPVVTFKPAGER